MMPDVTDLRPPGSGLHPRHYAALRAEILRTGAELSSDQLRDLTDALRGLIRLGRSGRHPDAWVKDEGRAFA